MIYPPFFDTSAGIGVDAQPGPYVFEGDVRVFPLLSSRRHLQRFIDAYLNRQLGDKAYFSVTSDHVLLISTNFFTAIGGDGVGISRARSLTFHVPVYFEDADNQTNGMVQVFTFDRTIPGVITDREVRGLNASKATIDVPRNRVAPRHVSVEDRRELLNGSVFLEDLNPMGGQTHNQSKVFLTLTTMVSNFLGNDIAARDDVLIEMLNDGSQKPDLPDAPVRKLARPIHRLVNGRSDYNVFTMKQFPDAYDERRACYQALMVLPNRFKDAQLLPMPQDCELRIYKFRSHPIVETLGLKNVVDLEPRRRAVSVKPENPFLVRNVTRFEAKGETLWYRYDQTWQRYGVKLDKNKLAFDPYQSAQHYLASLA